ncbi:MAG: hypothetical protein KME46_29850 [Brasilonema angustatum HA4187-MV1]|jgi:hypothetical protein|nr:hypothetical protein [Brasilonema angustatum HA4187-MV1]
MDLPVSNKRKATLREYKRELQNLGSMIARELKAINEDGDYFTVGQAMRSVSSEVSRLAAELKVLEELINAWGAK